MGFLESITPADIIAFVAVAVSIISVWVKLNGQIILISTQLAAQITLNQAQELSQNAVKSDLSDLKTNFEKSEAVMRFKQEQHEKSERKTESFMEKTLQVLGEFDHNVDRNRERFESINKRFDHQDKMNDRLDEMIKKLGENAKK
jgi:hypothetical protein